MPRRCVRRVRTLGADRGSCGVEAGVERARSPARSRRPRGRGDRPRVRASVARSSSASSEREPTCGEVGGLGPLAWLVTLDRYDSRSRSIARRSTEATNRLRAVLERAAAMSEAASCETAARSSGGSRRRAGPGLPTRAARGCAADPRAVAAGASRALPGGGENAERAKICGSPSSSSWKSCSGAEMPLSRYSPRSLVDRSATSARVSAESRICRPWPAPQIRAARWTSSPR